ncbi:leucine-rich repeat serine/threonine-protein kinase 1-like [Dysidea avara]|uniref:leucine-rich repeat serine/threonine-protein kinase 1-like n=1 Tax=Dysidea avara TaxID=196820 RepID=UPI003316D47D
MKTAAMKSFTKKEWTSADELIAESAVSEALTESSTQVDKSNDSSSVSVVFPKRPQISMGRMAEAHQNTLNELSVLSQLQHENIISLLSVVVTPPSILIEYAPMGTMKLMYETYHQSSQRLSPCVSQITIVQIASGIEFLHKRSIVYRDLKGDNVLVWRFPTPNNPPLVATNNEVLIKLSDYGIGQFASINGLRGFAGTPGFIAPEIIKYHGKEVYSNKVDIFSLGMVIYELITLHPPYDKFNQQQANQAIESGVRPSLSKKDLNSLILQRELMIWCWQQDPEMRPTATQVVEVARSQQFCRLVDGIRIDNDGRVLCVCHREIPITLRQKN